MEHAVPQKETDPYQALQPTSPTQESDLCICSDAPPIALQTHLSPNPIACLRCNGEVAPERIGFPAKLAHEIAYWRNLAESLYTLWLDSGDYEQWAKAELEKPTGSVNVIGLDVVRDLNAHRRTYYWWFEDNSDDDFVPLAKCPVCSGDLIQRLDKLVCEKCSIVVPNGHSRFDLNREMIPNGR
jgi:hypothetical protein